MIILYFCSRSAQHQWCCIITTYSLFVSRGRCDVAMQMTGAGYQIWGVVAVRSSDTDTTNSLINRVRGVEEVVKQHQSHQRSFNGQSGARCPHYLEMISPPPRPSVIREYKTMCRGPCVSLGILLLILRDLLRYLGLSWVRGSMSRLLSLFIPFSQFIFHVSELRAVCKVYSREKILLRIQVTIIIHAKQIKLPNRPLWAITFIDSDWRIEHSHRFLSPSNAFHVSSRLNKPEQILKLSSFVWER